MLTPAMNGTGPGLSASADARPRRGLFLFNSLAWLVLACFATGCAQPKRTWADWMAARAQMVSAPPTFVSPTIEGEPPLTIYHPDYTNGSPAKVGPRKNLEARNPDFPATHIETVYIDLTCPSNAVHLVWVGPLAGLGP